MKKLNIFKKIIGKIKLIHSRILDVDMNSIEENQPRNPYQAFGQWFLDILVYGILATLVYLILTLSSDLRWILLSFALGIGRWIYLEMLKDTIKAFR